jgi:hypothetical protein
VGKGRTASKPGSEKRSLSTRGIARPERPRQWVHARLIRRARMAHVLLHIRYCRVSSKISYVSSRHLSASAITPRQQQRLPLLNGVFARAGSHGQCISVRGLFSRQRSRFAAPALAGNHLICKEEPTDRKALSVATHSLSLTPHSTTLWVSGTPPHPREFRCCYMGGDSTLPRASSVASSSSPISSSVKSRIFFWRAKSRRPQTPRSALWADTVSPRGTGPATS